MEEQHLAIADIIYKHKTHQYLSEEEKVILHDWLNENVERKLWFDSIRDVDTLKEQLREFLNYNEKADLWSKYQQKFPDQFVEPIKKRRPWKMLVAAASVTIVIGAALYVFFKGTYTHKNDQLATTNTEDIKPGTDKAILEIDGRRFVLDEIADGVIEDKEAKVTKQKGALSFSANDKSAATVYSTIRTPRGGQYQVMLPDGSKVWLNAGSVLTFPAVFTGNERRVQLRGEGYFEIATLRLRSGQKAPFIVSVLSVDNNKSADVTVLGTHFNIQSYENDEAVKTTLLEGKVKVDLPVNKNESVFLSPGQQASIAVGSEKIKVKAVDAEQSIAWKNNMFVFEQSTITEIMNTVQRWYDVEIEIKKSSSQQFNATIPRDITIKKLFRLLEEASDGRMHFSLEGKKVIVQ